GQWVAIRVDDVVEESRRVVNRLPQPAPREVAPLDEAPDLDAPERAGLEREERLFATGVRRLDLTQAWRRLELVDAVDEHDTRIAAGPRSIRDGVEHAARVELAGDLAGPRVHEVVGRPGANGGHERIGRRDGQVEVPHPARIELRGDERE